MRKLETYVIKSISSFDEALKKMRDLHLYKLEPTQRIYRVLTECPTWGMSISVQYYVEGPTVCIPYEQIIKIGHDPGEYLIELEVEVDR